MIASQGIKCCSMGQRFTPNQFARDPTENIILTFVRSSPSKEMDTNGWRSTPKADLVMINKGCRAVIYREWPKQLESIQVTSQHVWTLKLLVFEKDVRCLGALASQKQCKLQVRLNTDNCGAWNSLGTVSCNNKAPSLITVEIRQEKAYIGAMVHVALMTPHWTLCLVPQPYLTFPARSQ